MLRDRHCSCLLPRQNRCLCSLLALSSHGGSVLFCATARCDCPFECRPAGIPLFGDGRISRECLPVARSYYIHVPIDPVCERNLRNARGTLSLDLISDRSESHIIFLPDSKGRSEPPKFFTFSTRDVQVRKSRPCT